jgi:hypothetical protein
MDRAGGGSVRRSDGHDSDRTYLARRRPRTRAAGRNDEGAVRAQAAPAAAPPDLGRKATTQVDAPSLPPMEPNSLARLNVPEIPPDPPP